MADGLLPATRPPGGAHEATTEASPSQQQASDLCRLVQAAQNGDRPALEVLYAQYARAVHGILLSRVPRSEVDDLLQDVFLIAMQRLATLRNPDAFGGWLAAIARNHALDYLRRAPRTTELDEPGQRRIGRHPGSDEQIAPADRIDAIAVLEAIRSLPEAYREALMLRLVEGMTGPEIAARLGLTSASVRVNLHRGMKKLRERLGVRDE